MIVVSNTSPIMNSAAIGQLAILEGLFHKLIIPEAVHRELASGTSGQTTSSTFETPSWVEIWSLADRSLADLLELELDAGEAEAIASAMEAKADLLLLDERRGRNAARRLGIRVTGLLGVLIAAKQRGLISQVKPLLDELIGNAGFWVSPQLYRRVIQEAAE